MRADTGSIDAGGLILTKKPGLFAQFVVEREAEMNFKWYMTAESQFFAQWQP
jgi:hypothetical protein